MSVAGLVLGIIGTVLGALALAWNTVAFLRQHARPKLAPVIGVRTDSGLFVGGPITDQTTEAMTQAAQELPGQVVVGVEVTNAGRAPLHVARWLVRAEPSKISVLDFGPADLSDPTVPCDIAPGETRTFLTGLDTLRQLGEQIGGSDAPPQKIRFALASGGRLYRSKPVDPAVLASEADQSRPE